MLGDAPWLNVFGFSWISTGLALLLVVAGILACPYGVQPYARRVFAYIQMRMDWRFRALDANGDLHLSGKDLKPTDIAFIANSVRRNLPIKRLYLSRNNLDGDSATVLAEALRGNRLLSHLDLGGNDIGSRGCSTIAAKLKAISTPFACTLTSLDLSNNINLPRLDSIDGVSEPSEAPSWVRALCEALKLNVTLKRLYLHSNCINDAGAAALATAVRQNSSLVQITLHCNEIGVTGACNWANTLKYNTTLTSLNLCDNFIKDDGALSLASCIGENTTMNYLNLRSNPISDLGRESLRATSRHGLTLSL